MAWEQVNRQKLEETIYVALSQFVGSGEEERGWVFLNLSYGGKGIKKLPKELTTELLCLKLTTISAFCGVKRYMQYIRFLLDKTS